MAFRLTAKVCHCCNRGIPQNAMKTVVWDKWRSGTHEMVNNWTCPTCRSVNKLVELFGRPITSQRYNTLAAL